MRIATLLQFIFASLLFLSAFATSSENSKENEIEEEIDYSSTEKRIEKLRLLPVAQSYIISFDHRIIQQTTNGMTTAITTYLTQISNAVATYFFNLLTVQFSPTTISTQACSLTTSFATTSLSTHLLIITSYVNEPLSSYFANGYSCQRGTVTQLFSPTLGVIIFNIGVIPATPTNYSFKQHTKEMIHEIIHIFGFTKDQLVNWINPVTSTKYGSDSLIITSSPFRGFSNTFFLITPYVVETAKNYFGCSTLTMLQLENQEDYTIGTAKLHFERSILGNEAMTPTILEGDSVFSIFTGAVLKDMNYFSTVDFNFLDDISFGKSEGCSYLSNLCTDLSQPKEFIYTVSTKACDFYGQGIGDDLIDNYVDPGCVIPMVSSTSLCSNASFNDLATQQIASGTSKCFTSNSVATGSAAPSPDSGLRCFQTICASNYSTISIKFFSAISSVVVCGSGQAGISINLSSVTSSLSPIITGTIKCPSDYQAFCTTPSKCPNDCSMNGFCVNGNCVCLSGYANTDCATVCPTNQFWNGVSCVASCAALTYANPNNTCLSSCPDGYYKSGSTCTKCNSTCKKCTSATNCSSCNYPFSLNSTLCSLICDTTCLTCFGTASTQCYSCISGYFLSGYSCLQCTSPCNTCSLLATTCSSCISNYTKVGSVCNPICDASCSTCSLPLNSSSCLTCPSSSFLNSSQCQSCSSNCSTCITSASNCLSCPTNYYLNAGVCYPICHSSCSTCSSTTSNSCSSCFNGFYLNVSNSCVSCPSNCVGCTSSTVCTACSKYYQLSVGSCISTGCNQNNCSTCDSPNNVYKCLTCSQGYYLFDSECVPCDSSCLTCSNQPYLCSSCSPSRTLNSSTNSCDYICFSNCLTCSSPKSSTSCITCISGYVLKVATNECIQCTSPCNTCFGQSTECTSCVSNYQLSGNSCIPVCHSSCLTCSQPLSLTSCTNCFDNFYLDPLTSKCVACSLPCINCTSATYCLSCTINYTLNGSTCALNCDSTCQTCDLALSSSHCLSCFTGYYLTNTKQCLICSAAAFCKTCVSTASYCLTCLSNYFLSAGICNPICANNCSTCTLPLLYSSCTLCKSGYYKEISAGIVTACNKCQSPCLTCDPANGQICLTCIAQYQNIPPSTTCVYICHSSCLTCSAPQNLNACLTCQTGYYLDGNTYSCIQCETGCATCINYSNYCQSCLTNYILVDNKCQFDCVTLAPSCFTCSSSTICLSCYPQKYLTPSKTCASCITPCFTCTSTTSCYSCILGYSYDASAHTCTIICYSNCLTCSAPLSPTQCNSCQPGYYLSSYQCLPCTSPCLTCNLTATTCLSCITNYYINATACLPSCGLNCITCTTPGTTNTCTLCASNYYIVNASLATNHYCDWCLSPCQNCVTTSSICTSCIINHTLVGNMCLASCHSSCKSCSLPNNSLACTSCNSNAYLSSSQCPSCSPNCLTCVQSSTNCLSCYTDYHLSPSTITLDQNLCLPNCHSSCQTCSSPNQYNSCLSCFDGYYLSSAQCLPCISPCKTCSTAAICLSCIPYHTFTSPACVPNSCDQTCQTCSQSNNASACSSCYSDSYLSSGKCIQCTPPCNSCTSSSVSSCTSCITNYQAASVSLTFSCNPICDSSCLTCSAPRSSIACLSCSIGYFLDSSTNSCMPCDGFCTACASSSSNCSGCITGYTLNNSTCKLACTTGCSSCEILSTNCLSCLAGYQFNSTSNTCQLVCHSSCLTCSYSLSDTSCLSCHTSYYLVNSSCLLCPPATYPSGELCLDCFENCISCNSGTTCNVCRVGYTLNSGLNGCNQNSPQTFIVSQKCNYSCSSCIDSYSTCITCAANRQIFHSSNPIVGQCLCPSGTSDEGVAQCQASSSQQRLQEINTTLFGMSVATSVLVGFASGTPLSIFQTIQFSQEVSINTYINFQQSPSGLDDTFHMLYSSHISSITDFSSIIPSKKFPFQRILISDDTKWALSEKNSGVYVDDYPRIGSDRLVLNGKSFYFLINAIPLLILNAMVWVVDRGLKNVGATELEDSGKLTWRTKLRRFWCKSVPTGAFMLSFQETMILCFFQFENFNFSTALDGISSVLSVFALLLCFYFIYFLFKQLVIKGIYSNQNKVHPLSPSSMEQPLGEKSIDNSLLKPNLSISKVHPLTKIPMQAVEIFEGIPQEELELIAAKLLENERENLQILDKIFYFESQSQKYYLFVLFFFQILTAMWSVLLFSSPAAQIALLIIIRTAFLFFTFIVKPYKNIWSQRMYLLCETAQIVILIILAVMLDTSEDDSSKKTRSATLIIIIILFMLLFISLTAIISLLKTIYQKIWGESAKQEMSTEKKEIKDDTSISSDLKNNSFDFQENQKKQMNVQEMNIQPPFDRSFLHDEEDDLLKRNERQSPAKGNNPNLFNQNKAPSRLILFDDSSNLFHFMVPREEQTYKPVIAGILQGDDQVQ